MRTKSKHQQNIISYDWNRIMQNQHQQTTNKQRKKKEIPNRKDKIKPTQT